MTSENADQNSLSSFVKHGEHLFCSPAFAEDVQAGFMQMYLQYHTENVTPVYICESMTEVMDVLKYTPTLSHIILSKNVEKALKNIVAPHEQEGDMLIHMMLDCKYLHNRHIADLLSQKLYDHGYLDSETIQPYRLVFQEGLLNAIEHGNLGLSSVRDKKRDFSNWLDMYYEKLNKILYETDDGYKPIRIYVSEESRQIHTRILDVGSGFDIKTAYAGLDIENPYGKGLSLAAALSDVIMHEQGGKCFYFRMNGYHQANLALPDRTSAKERGRILIVDDQKVNRDISKHFLKTAGYRFIETANNGLEAIEKAANFLPDLILMDVMMPEMDGFEACQALKSISTTQDIPILFLSGLTDASTRTKGYQLGAVDYVNKPIDRHEMVVRAEVHILNGMMYKAMRQYSDRIREDLTDARRFQLELLPTRKEVEKLETTYALEIESDYRPTEELAGDYWSMVPINETCVGIMMVDFTGHGVKAALNTIRFNTFFKELESLWYDPYALVLEVNKRLHDSLQIGTFATFFYGVLNLKTRELQYVSCGAPPIIRIPKDMYQDIELRLTSGTPLGLLPNDKLKLNVHHIKLSKQDTLFLYSDALTETVHKNGDMWEDQGVLNVLNEARATFVTSSPLREVLRDFHRTASKPLKDDLTLLSVKLDA